MRPGATAANRRPLDVAFGLVTAVHLTISEVVSLWLAARLSRVASDLPWSEEARSGMAKLLASLPRAKARDLRAICRRVIVGPPASTRIPPHAARR